MKIAAIVHRTKQPKVAVGLSVIGMALLSALAALPYQLGEIATIIPPEWKPLVALVGFLASSTLSAVYLIMGQSAPTNDSQPTQEIKP